MERDRLARDIHDDLGAGPTRLALLSEHVVRESHDSAVQAFAGRLAGEASRLIDNLGELVWATDTKHDRLPDLLAFLREHAAVFLDDAGLLAHLEFPASVPDIQVGGLLRRTIHFAIKEALTNAVRHAGATQIAVTARLRESGLDPGQPPGPTILEVTVADNGRDLSPPGVGPRPEFTTSAPGPSAASHQQRAVAQASSQAASASGVVRRASSGEGHGLPGMRARLADCGGSLELRTATGQGTTLILRVPLKPTPLHGTA